MSDDMTINRGTLDAATIRKRIVDTMDQIRDSYGTLGQEIAKLQAVHDRENARRVALPEGVDEYSAAYRNAIDSMADVADLHDRLYDRPNTDAEVARIHKGQSDMARLIIKVLQQSLNGNFEHLNREGGHG